MQAVITVLNEHIPFITNIPEVTITRHTSVYTHATQLDIEYDGRFPLLKIVAEIPYRYSYNNNKVKHTNLLNKDHVFIKGHESSIY
jgi:hypothetical protein